MILSEGRLSNTLSPLYTSSGGETPVLLVCHNIGTAVETIVLQFVHQNTSSSWIKRVVLYPDESFEFQGILIANGDSLQGVTTNSDSVSFLLIRNGQGIGFLNYSNPVYLCTVYDANGIPKVHPVFSTIR